MKSLVLLATADLRAAATCGLAEGVPRQLHGLRFSGVARRCWPARRVHAGMAQAQRPPVRVQDNPPRARPAANARQVLCEATNFFPPADDEDVNKDRWRKVRSFISGVLAEPALNVFSGCDPLDVEVLARALIARLPSAEWVGLMLCVERVVFVWEFLLLVRPRLDESPQLQQAVGELLLFCTTLEDESISLWEAKATAEAKAYRDDWEFSTPEKYEQWMAQQGITPAVSHVWGSEGSRGRLQEQAQEEQSGQVWPGRKLVRPFPEDKEAEMDRQRAGAKRAAAKRKKPKLVRNAWDEDDCRHDFPENVLRSPGVITFMCGCGYVVGFELLRETESPAHVVAALVQRFKKLPQVVYFDTACQAQRNALRRVPWLSEQSSTAWFIDRFHRVNHNCSPVFNADQYPFLTRGHDTSSAERTHSIKKKTKNALTYMTQRRFITRSRYITAHNNIRVSQRRDAVAMATHAKEAGAPSTGKEIQHKPVESYFHAAMVNHCEVGECTCRGDELEGAPPGLAKRV